MGCNEFLTKEDDALIEASMRGENTGFSPEILERTMPEVERVIEQRTIECLEENVERAKEELSERLAQEGREPTNLERLDLEVRPTGREEQEMYRVGRGIGMESWEIIDMPVISGIKDPESVEDHIDTETMRELMREALEFLQKSDIPIEFRDQATVNMIVFVNKLESDREKGTIVLEEVVRPEKLMEPKELGRSRNIYVFKDKKGNLPPRDLELFPGEKLPPEKVLPWILSHGIAHINEPRIDTVTTEHYPEWMQAVRAQLKVGLASDYAGHTEAAKDIEILQNDREFRAEHFAAWATDLPRLCPEMKEFFGKYFSE